jgi:hypothetical protein
MYVVNTQAHLRNDSHFGAYFREDEEFAYPVSGERICELSSNPQWLRRNPC